MLGVYLLALLADFTWYRAHIPPGFRDARWSGSWETSNYGGLAGRLLVLLPDPIPEDEDFRAEALVYYPIYSVWQTGRFVRMDLAVDTAPKASRPVVQQSRSRAAACSDSRGSRAGKSSNTRRW